MTPEEFRRRGHQVVDLIADYRARVASLPVMSRVEPGEVMARLPVAPPEQAEPFEGILRDLEQVLMPGLSHWQHPDFFGYFPSNGELSSVQAHSSVDKAALLAGFGRDNVRHIATDPAYAMRADALAAAVRDDLQHARRPCAVVATTGTTTSTALDPVGAIAAVAREHGLWLHVDAAMAGSAMILPECRWMWEGIEAADSLVLNPHKWLGAAFDCSVYLVREAEHLVRVLSTNPSYLQSAADGRVKNLRDWGIPLGRRFRALKLWCLIREQGLEGLQRRLRRDLESARWLEAQVKAAQGWQVLAPVPLQTLCVRHEPPGLSAKAIDRHTLG